MGAYLAMDFREIEELIERGESQSLEFKVVEAEDKKVVIIEVTESAEKPVFFKNHGYKNIYVEGGSTLNPRRHGFGDLGQAITYVSKEKPLFFFGIAGAVFTIVGLILNAIGRGKEKE